MEKKTIVKCATCNKDITVSNWTVGGKYWCSIECQKNDNSNNDYIKISIN